MSTYITGDSENKFENFHDALRDAIENKRFSYSELARKTGFHPSQVSKWVRGINTPNTDTKYKLSNVLGVKFYQNHGLWSYVDPKLGIRAILPDISPRDIASIKQTADEVVEYEFKEEYTSESRQEKSSTRIQKARERAGYSQDDLADKLGVHRTTIGKWESNKAQPSIENYEKMSEILKVSPIWLMSIDQYTSQIPNEHALSRKNIADLRTRLAQIQAHAGLPEHDFEILHAAIGLLGRLLRNIEE
jgi:transcriptional regulator with XRE-family HTH domain